MTLDKYLAEHFLNIRNELKTQEGQLRGSFKTKFAKRTAVRKNLVQLKPKMFYCDDRLFLIFTSFLSIPQFRISGMIENNHLW